MRRRPSPSWLVSRGWDAKKLEAALRQYDLRIEREERAFTVRQWRQWSEQWDSAFTRHDR